MAHWFPEVPREPAGADEEPDFAGVLTAGAAGVVVAWTWTTAAASVVTGTAGAGDVYGQKTT
jgi:hypothetical protein